MTIINNSILLPIFVVLIAYMGFMVFKQRKAQKAEAEKKRNLEPGTRVLLSNGFQAIYQGEGDGYILTEIAPGIITRCDPRMIYQILEKDETLGQEVKEHTETLPHENPAPFDSDTTPEEN